MGGSGRRVTKFKASVVYVESAGQSEPYSEKGNLAYAKPWITDRPTPVKLTKDVNIYLNRAEPAQTDSYLKERENKISREK